jgi:YHS domain-containing protein
VQAQGKASAPERLALKGYDPVAYFTEGKPIAGLPEFEVVWDGQRYRFATARHRDMFKADPEKYAPQFGGACAMNMANGVRRESDPSNWVISNGRLYVFAGTAGIERFRQDPLNASQSAEANWQTIKKTVTQ